MATSGTQNRLSNMANFLSRWMGLTDAERAGGAAQVDALLVVRHNQEMGNDLIAVDVPSDDVGDYSVSEPGWYAVDDAGKVVLGPFTSLAECDRAILDRNQHAVPKAN